MKFKLWFYNHFFYPLYKDYIDEECSDYLAENAREYVCEYDADMWNDRD